MISSQPEASFALSQVFDEFFAVKNSSADENDSSLAVVSGTSLRSELLVLVNVSAEQCAQGYGSDLCAKCMK